MSIVEERSPSALEQLYDRHAPAMITFAARMLGDRAAARDALQEAWFHALSHAAQWSGRACLLRGTSSDGVVRSR